MVEFGYDLGSSGVRLKEGSRVGREWDREKGDKGGLGGTTTFNITE